MAGRIRRALTFANVCSFLALTVALGTGGAYAADTVFSTDIVDGEVKNADIGGNQVTTTKIKAGNVMTTDIGADAVDSSKVLDESLNATDLGTDSVGATEIADDSIDTGEIAPNSLYEWDLAGGSVQTSELQDGGVATADLANNAVTGAKIANNTVTSSDLAGGGTTGSIGVSPIPNGRCAQITMSVGGTQVGEVPIMATNGALQNGVFVYPMRVPAAGQVEASVCNLSGGTMTPISNLPVRILTIG